LITYKNKVITLIRIFLDEVEWIFIVGFMEASQ